MSIVHETLTLRKTLAAWATNPEWALLSHYDLLRKKPPTSVFDRSYRFLNSILFFLGLARLHVTAYSWVPKLKHAEVNGNHSTLLIWAVDLGRDELRTACEAFVVRLQDVHSLVPVLVTDVTDFAYFSRLKWLIEYVPELSGKGVSYHKRKLRYLAWRYREALVVPAAAGYASKADWDELMKGKR